MKHAWFSGEGFAQPSANDGPVRYLGRDLLSVAQSVAASSAFPALFPPIRLDGARYLFDETRSDRYVTDAGVYDNLGVSGFLEEPFKDAVWPVFVSDATATSDWSAETRLNLFNNLLRSVDIIQQRAADLQRREAGLPKRDTRAGIAAPGIEAHDKFVLFDIAREGIETAPKINDVAQRHLSFIRTDLDAFSAEEIRALVHHGYSVAWHGLEQLKLLPAHARPQFDDWKERWPRAKPARSTIESELDKLIAARRSTMRLLSWKDPVGVLNLFVLLALVLGPFIVWSWLQHAASSQRLLDKQQLATERILAYQNLNFDPIPLQANLPESEGAESPTYEGLKLVSLDKVFDLRRWVRVPPERRGVDPLEAANQQSIYSVSRESRRTDVTFVLKTSGLAVVPDVPDQSNFHAELFQRRVGRSEDRYAKHVLVKVDLLRIPPQQEFPLALRSTYYNAFQKEIEDAAFKAYTNARSAKMVVLFPPARVPARFNFWWKKSDRDSIQVLSPPPFYCPKENGLYFEVENPKEGSTYGIVFTWDDHGGTGLHAAEKAALDQTLKPL